MRIGEVRKRLRDEWGIDLDKQQLRRLQAKHLFRSGRSKTGTRLYSERDYENLTRAILLLSLGISYQDINNSEIVNRRISFLSKVIGNL